MIRSKYTEHSTSQDRWLKHKINNLHKCISRFNPPHVCAYLKPWPGISTLYVLVIDLMQLHFLYLKMTALMMSWLTLLEIPQTKNHESPSANSPNHITSNVCFQNVSPVSQFHTLLYDLMQRNTIKVSMYSREWDPPPHPHTQYKVCVCHWIIKNRHSIF